MQMSPSELRVSKDRKLLTIKFVAENKTSESQYELPAEMLRVFSPSAEVKGHSPAERKIVGGKRNVTITSLEPVGNYAVRIIFDDMHSTGIYTWDYFHTLGHEKATRWSKYLAELERLGLNRDQPGIGSATA